MIGAAGRGKTGGSSSNSDGINGIAQLDPARTGPIPDWVNLADKLLVNLNLQRADRLWGGVRGGGGAAEVLITGNA